MKKNVLGLYLSDRVAQSLVLEPNADRWTLHALAEWPNRLFSYAGDDTPGMDEFVEHLSTFLSQKSLPVHTAAVALDTGLLFVNTIPIEDPSAPPLIEEQIAWELNEYFPDSPRNAFISDYETMLKPDSRPYTEVLAVSVRREFVHKIQRAMKRLNLQLGVIDGDHFGAATAMRMNHPETARKRVLLAGVKQERVDISLLQHDGMESYCYRMISTDEDIVHALAAETQRHDAPPSLMIFGDRLDEQLVGELRAALPTPVHVLDPFHIVTVDTSLRLKSDPTVRSFRYAAAVGVALRQK